MPKRDKLGIHSKIENLCIESLTLAIKAAFESKNNKFPHLSSARIMIGTLKRLVRVENEINIINAKQYIELESELQEISKMTNGWIKYLEQERPR